MEWLCRLSILASWDFQLSLLISMVLRAFPPGARDASSSSLRTQEPSLWSKPGSLSCTDTTGSLGFAGHTQTRVPLFLWFSFTVAVLNIPSYIARGFTAAAASKSRPPTSISMHYYFIFPFEEFRSVFFLIGGEYNGIKRNCSCFRSVAWLSRKAGMLSTYNRYTGSSVLTLSSQCPWKWLVRGKGINPGMGWSQRPFFQSCGSGETLVFTSRAPSALF